MDTKKILFIFALGLCIIATGYFYLRKPVEVALTNIESPTQKALREATDTQAYTKEDIMNKKIEKKE